MRYLTLVFSALLCTATYAATQVSVFIGEPRVSIGINLPVYPEFVRVPGYPVYYAPRVSSNVFFYDGLYWAFYDDQWYASTWYNGPWGVVAPEVVPVYVLRVPVRYYRAPPAYFSAWAVDAAPRWDVHWGATWAQQRAGWDSWNRSSVPAAAPLPVYQRQYSAARYPSVQQQLVLQSQQYRYQPRETVVRQYYSQQVVQTSRAAAQQKSAAAQSASAHAPGQLKREQGAESAKQFAPGQLKKQQDAQSAREFAPGHVKKQQVEQSTPTVVAPAPQAERRAAPPSAKHAGKGNRDRDGEIEVDNPGQGQGQGQGQGHGQGHGKGHGKD